MTDAGRAAIDAASAMNMELMSCRIRACPPVSGAVASDLRASGGF